MKWCDSCFMIELRIFLSCFSQRNFQDSLKFHFLSYHLSNFSHSINEYNQTWLWAFKKMHDSQSSQIKTNVICKRNKEILKTTSSTSKKVKITSNFKFKTFARSLAKVFTFKKFIKKLALINDLSDVTLLNNDVAKFSTDRDVLTSHFTQDERSVSFSHVYA